MREISHFQIKALGSVEVGKEGLIIANINFYFGALFKVWCPVTTTKDLQGTELKGIILLMRIKTKSTFRSTMWKPN